MDLTSCEVCFEEFALEVRIPKVLECGHSFCSRCLSNVFQSQKTCPKCTMPLTKLSADDYPVNYTLMNLLETVKELTDSKLMRSLHDLKKEFTLSMKDLDKLIEEKTVFKNLLMNDLAKIQQIIDTDKMDLDFLEVRKVIQELKEDSESVDKMLNSVKLMNFRKTYSIAVCKYPRQFLSDISLRLHQGETIYARETFGNETRFGKMTLENNVACIYALSLSTVARSASVIWDMKKCMTKKNFFPFIQMEKKLFFTLTSSSSLALQFIKFCTGETGPTFKGSHGEITHSETTGHFGKKVTHHSISIEKYMLNNVETANCIDYNVNIFTSASESTHNGDVTVVEMHSNGRCIIQKCNLERKCSNVIGLLSRSCYNVFNEAKSCSITDSGICFLT